MQGSAEASAYRDIEIDLTGLVFRDVKMVLTFAAVAIVGTLVLLARRFNDPWLWRCALVMLVICLARIALVVAFDLRRSPLLTHAQATRWNAAYAALLLLNSTGIAIAAVYNFSHHDITARAMLAAGVFIICSGISARFGTRPWVEQGAGLIMMAGLFWGVLRTGEQDAWVFCVMILLFAYGHCVAVRTKFELVVEQLRSRQKLRQFAEHDSLTGLPNRRQFRARLDEVAREPGSFAVLFLDLDGFKSVNDTFGHAIGDELLRHVSRRLQGIIRDSDLIARLGGDEFALLHTPDASRASAEALARRILQTVSAPYAIGGHALSIGTSIGIQLSGPGNNKPEKLLSDADAALYRVKQEGKGSFQFIALPDPEVTPERTSPRSTPPRPLPCTRTESA